jgi:hypothetical protein
MAALSVFTITSATGNGTTTTYTGTITSGATPLKVGMPIIVVGFVAQPGFNGTKLINGGNLTTTFTALNATNASETHAATGTVDPEGVPVYPTDETTNALGYGVSTRSGETFNVPLGNAQGVNLSGLGQIYPTGRN